MHLKKPMSLIIRLNTVIIRETGFPVSSLTGGEFNNANVRGRSSFWYLSLFIMCKAWYQYSERPRALTSLNSTHISHPIADVVYHYICSECCVPERLE